MNRLNSFSAKTNLPKKKGFEIWFAVVIEPATRKAIWVRYTKFSSTEMTKAIVWASWFDANSELQHLQKTVTFPIEEFVAKDSGYETPWGKFSLDNFQGNLDSFSWDLQFQHNFSVYPHAPKYLDNSIFPKMFKTHSNVCSPFAHVTGSLVVQSIEHKFTQAYGMITHIWGKDRVPWLYWIYVPAFEEDKDCALEIVHVKAKNSLPSLTFARLLYKGKVRQQTLPNVFLAPIRANYPEIQFKVSFLGIHINGTAKLGKQITAYNYRNLNGQDRYVEQSDLSSVTCKLKHRQTEKTLTCQSAAVEFHGLEPWSEIGYENPFAQDSCSG